MKTILLPVIMLIFGFSIFIDSYVFNQVIVQRINIELDISKTPINVSKYKNVYDDKIIYVIRM